MKYVIVEDWECELAILFNEIIKHDSVANGRKIISAGFCSIVNDSVAVWGESTSLKLKFRPEDAEIIQKAITFTC